MSAQKTEEIIDAHDDSYLFKRWRSPIISFRPGESSYTKWAALPGEEEDA